LNGFLLVQWNADKGTEVAIRSWRRDCRGPGCGEFQAWHATLLGESPPKAVNEPRDLAIGFYPFTQSSVVTKRKNPKLSLLRFFITELDIGRGRKT
jgi:hypothetical protein